MQELVLVPSLIVPCGVSHNTNSGAFSDFISLMWLFHFFQLELGLSLPSFFKVLTTYSNSWLESRNSLTIPFQLQNLVQKHGGAGSRALPGGSPIVA